MSSSAPSPVPPSLAIVNARAFTGDARRPWADAVFISGGTIGTVASSAEVKKRAGATTRVIDAGGMMLLAGDAAHALSLQWTPGPLRAGEAADLVLLDRDITRLPPERVTEARVVLTIVGGQVEYDARTPDHP